MSAQFSKSRQLATFLLILLGGGSLSCRLIQGNDVGPEVEPSRPRHQEEDRSPPSRMSETESNLETLLAQAQAAVVEEKSTRLPPASVASDVESVRSVIRLFLRDGQSFLPKTYRFRSKVILDDLLVGEETGRPTPGLCLTREHVIVINRQLWLAYSEGQREVVLFHELGHCELGRLHSSGNRPEGGPVSLMNRNSVAGTSFFEANRTYYVHELFSNYPSPVHYRKGE